MHRTTRSAVLAASTAALAVAAALTAVPAVAAPAAGGSLVLVGGALAADNEQIYGEIISRAGGPLARIGVLTAASIPASQDPDAADPEKCSNSECNGAYYSGLFERHGAADAQWIPVDLDHIADADSDAVVAQVESMTGFFFGGGDQFRYVTTLLHGEQHTDSKVLAAIRAKLAAGAVVSGTSAGAQIAAGRDMVTGGESYEGLRDGSAPGYFDEPTTLGYLPEGGFGFLSSGLIDTHTGTNGREGRAIRLASDTHHDRVYALDEDTALVVDHAGSDRESVRVMGTNGVAVLDLRHSRARSDARGWSVAGVSYSYLTDGDGYDPRSHRARPASDKRPLRPTSSAPVPPNGDVFSSPANPDPRSYSLRTTARALVETTRARSAEAATWETGPRFTVTVSRPGATAWTSDGRTARSITDLRLAIAPS